jgi:ribosomal protein S18 acetylase RimI-like enzyme
MLSTSYELAIRQATPEDAALLSELSTATFYDTFGSQNSPADMEAYLSSNFQVGQIREEFREQCTKYLIAEIQGKAVGYAKLGKKEVPEALEGMKFLELERLYVLTDYQNHKVGAALMSACIQCCVTQEFDVLWLGVWEHNTRAKKFYQDFGFIKFGEHPFVLGSDVQTDWMMKLDLIQN